MSNSKINLMSDKTIINFHNSTNIDQSKSVENTIKRVISTITQYTINYALPGTLNFAIGNFDSIEIVPGDDSKIFYCPINQKKTKLIYSEILKDGIFDAVNCFKFIESFLGTEYPPISIVFTKQPVSLLTGHGTAFLGVDQLPFANSIDHSFDYKVKLARLMCEQPFVTTGGAPYLQKGAAGYLFDNCVKFFFGNNEMLFMHRKNIDFVVKNDVKEKSLDDPTRSENSRNGKFFVTKAKLLFHVLETHLSRAFIQKILLALKNRRFVSTETMLRLIRDVCGKDMTTFFRTYACKPGLILFSCSFSVDQKKNRVILSIRQKPTSILDNCNRKFSGNILVRTHEIEGVYEHVYSLSKNELVFNYHTRTKKTKRNESEVVMPLLWLKIDPKTEYLCGIELNQPDFMFQEELLHDKTVFGQYDALRALEKRPSDDGCAVLERVLLDSAFFHRIRTEIAHSLSQITMHDYDGYQKLIQFFVKKFCYGGSTIVKQNDFSNFSNYFLQGGLLSAVSLANMFTKKMLEKEIVSREVILSFLNSVLKYNDNEQNEFSDSFYLSRIITSLANVLCSAKTKNLHASLEIIENYRLYDLVVPSYGHTITVSCIYTLTKLHCHGLITLNSSILKQYALSPNFYTVKMAALESLLLIFDDDNFDFVLNVIKNEHFFVVKHVFGCIRNLCRAIVFGNDTSEIINDEYYNEYDCNDKYYKCNDCNDKYYESNDELSKKRKVGNKKINYDDLNNEISEVNNEISEVNNEISEVNKNLINIDYLNKNDGYINNILNKDDDYLSDLLKKDKKIDESEFFKNIEKSKNFEEEKFNILREKPKRFEEEEFKRFEKSKNFEESKNFGEEFNILREEKSKNFEEEKRFEEEFKKNRVSAIDFYKKNLKKLRVLKNAFEPSLDEILGEILGLLENEVVFCKEEEKMHLHEFSEETEEEVEKVAEQSLTVVKFKREYFVEEPKIKVLLKMPQNSACDKFAAYFAAALGDGTRVDAVFHDFCGFNATDAIDEFIVENLCESDFFCTKPARICEIASRRCKKTDDLFSAYFAVIYVLTFEPFNSRLYLHCKNVINSLETLEINYLDPPKLIRMDEEKKIKLITFINDLMLIEESSPFLDEVDYKRHKFYKYVDIVRSPICLRKILTNLQTDFYSNYNAVLIDLYRIFTNCFLFNQQNSQIYTDAQFCLSVLANFIGVDSKSVFFDCETEPVKNCELVKILKDVNFHDLRWNECVEKAGRDLYLTVGHLNCDLVAAYTETVKCGGKAAREFRHAIRAVWRKLGGMFGENWMRILGMTRM